MYDIHECMQTSTRLKTCHRSGVTARRDESTLCLPPVGPRHVQEWDLATVIRGAGRERGTAANQHDLEALQRIAATSTACRAQARSRMGSSDRHHDIHIYIYIYIHIVYIYIDITLGAARYQHVATNHIVYCMLLDYIIYIYIYIYMYI